MKNIEIKEDNWLSLTIEKLKELEKGYIVFNIDKKYLKELEKLIKYLQKNQLN